MWDFQKGTEVVRFQGKGIFSHIDIINVASTSGEIFTTTASLCFIDFSSELNPHSITHNGMAGNDGSYPGRKSRCKSGIILVLPLQIIELRLSIGLIE